MDQLPRTILTHLLKTDTYARAVLPHMAPEHFKPKTPERVAFELISDYFKKYDSLPTPEALGIDLQAREDIDDKLFENTAMAFDDVIKNDAPVDPRWLLDQTEAFCKDAEFYNAITYSLETLKDKGQKNLSRSSVPRMMEKALNFTFDTRVGHDYERDAGDRWEHFHSTVSRVPFRLRTFMEMTQGGWEPGTLNIFMAGAGVGKSLMMCDLATFDYLDGRNVLYLTMELSEQKISQRIDANILDMSIRQTFDLDKETFLAKLNRAKSKTPGRIIVRQYPPRSAGSGHFRALLHELRVKQGFIPDIIYVDYINLCTPTTVNASAMNSYDRVKITAEELRALAIEMNIPMVSATQLNRSGYGNADPGMENTSDSIGLPMTVDFMAIIRTDEMLDELGQYEVIQVKSRYDDINLMRKFYIGVDKPKMRLYDLSEDVRSRDPNPPPVSRKMGDPLRPVT